MFNSYLGVYTSYLGGGYVFKPDTILSVDNLTSLQNYRWLDMKTRAVFIELNVFNPNINLFGYTVILFEILPVGQVLASSRVVSIDILGEKYATMNVVMVAFISIISCMILREIYLIFTLKRKYFSRWSKLVDWLIFLTAYAAFAIYTYKVYSRNKLLELIRLKMLDDINFSSLNNWIDLLNILLGNFEFKCSIFVYKDPDFSL